ncbi:MAG: phosphate-selective porin OprO/OprP [Myxococcota bacterium]|jgi:phosphate-selective porin OprO/OprP
MCPHQDAKRIATSSWDTRMSVKGDSSVSLSSPRHIAVLIFSLSFFATQTVAAQPLPPVSVAETTTGDGALDDRVVDQIAAAIAKKVDEDFPVKASYGSKGFRLETRDGNWQTNLQWRAQFRLTHPTRGDPRQVTNFKIDKEQTSFEARRLRMKIGGHGYQPWLKYYFEVDLQPTRNTSDSSSNASARVIDWRIDIAKKKEFGLRVGQWKIDYNRERVDSSGRQQFVERSIANRVFTIDRQVGVSFRGHLFEGTHADLKYFVGIFTGEGRGVANDDNSLMYTGRVQWNFLGRDLDLRQTDVERTELPTASLAFGVATNKGACTRWSSGGCGNLDGFARPGAPETVGQFRVVQSVQELAYKWQGFSFQQEFHWKRVTDRSRPSSSSRRDSDLFGGYAQAGYFFNEVIDFVPEELELAFRYAYVREPNSVNLRKNNKRSEYTVGANWFFSGHNNKITLDYSHLTLDDNVLARNVSDNRVRLQWDVSF